jgi:hypothetical protein
MMLKMIVINMRIIGTYQRMCRFGRGVCPDVDFLVVQK